MGQGKLLTPIVTHSGDLMDDDVIALSNRVFFSLQFLNRAAIDNIFSGDYHLLEGLVGIISVR